ncbi:MAG: restriction endonuclease [Phycisphaerales bacterium JB050]
MLRNLVQTAAVKLMCAIAIVIGILLLTISIAGGISLMVDPPANPMGGWIATGVLLAMAILLFGIAGTAQSSTPNRNESRYSKALKTRTAQAIRDIVSRHSHTLYTERCKLLIPDKYGLIDRSRWNAEKSHFTQNVAVPFLGQNIGRKQLHRECSYLLGSLGYETKQRSWESMAFDLIDAEIERSCQIKARELKSNTRQDDAFQSPDQFERWCAEQLEIAGWKCRVNGQTGDQGVDVVAKKDGRIMALQCKLYSQPAGNDSVQQVFAGKSFYAADFAAVVATAGYTPSARALAKQTGVLLLQPTELPSFTSFPKTMTR